MPPYGAMFARGRFCYASETTLLFKINVQAETDVRPALRPEPVDLPSGRRRSGAGSEVIPQAKPDRRNDLGAVQLIQPDCPLQGAGQESQDEIPRQGCDRQGEQGQSDPIEETRLPPPYY